MSHRALLEQWYERVWVQGDLNAIDEMFAPDVSETGLIGGLSVSPDEFRELVPALLDFVDTPRFVIERSIETGDWLAAVIRLEATSVDTGAPVSAGGQVMMRIRDGRIVEVFNHFDFIAFFAAAGMMPKDAMMLCLSRERLS